MRDPQATHDKLMRLAEDEAASESERKTARRLAQELVDSSRASYIRSVSWSALSASHAHLVIGIGFFLDLKVMATKEAAVRRVRLTGDKMLLDYAVSLYKARSARLDRLLQAVTQAYVYGCFPYQSGEEEPEGKPVELDADLREVMRAALVAGENERPAKPDRALPDVNAVAHGED